MGHKAKWEYFRAVYERYRKAGREAKQVMLNEFCLNTGYNRKYADTEGRDRRSMAILVEELNRNCSRWTSTHEADQ